MFAGVAVEDLDFVSILEIDAAVAAFVGDEEFDVQAEVAVLLLGYYVGCSVFSSCCRGVVAHEDFAGIDGVVDEFPFDGQ